MTLSGAEAFAATSFFLLLGAACVAGIAVLAGGIVKFIQNIF